MVTLPPESSPNNMEICSTNSQCNIVIQALCQLERVFFIGGGHGVSKFTLRRTEQIPLNCSVAPKRESMRLPNSPARVAMGKTSSCLRTVLDSHLVVEKPRRTNDNPMTLPAAAAARIPVFVTPPFVPFFTC